MDLEVISTNSTLSIFISGEHSSSELIFECVPADTQEIIEVGEGYTFAGRQLQVGPNKTRIEKLRVSVLANQDLSEENFKSLGLGDHKIGDFTFYPGSKNEDDWPWIEASLGVRVYVNESIYSDLKDTVNAGKCSARISIFLKTDALTRLGSHSNDDLRMSWKLGKDGADFPPPRIDVKMLRIALSHR